jgi:glycosyltransferase involved in cell wall biosynthesis
LARKGAYELREAARLLGGVRLALGGRLLESADFWKGIETVRAADDWLSTAKVVVLPSWVESQPRRLLQAVAAGIPAIATPACGLKDIPGVTIIPEGDSLALAEALRPHVSPKATEDGR